MRTPYRVLSAECRVRRRAPRRRALSTQHSALSTARLFASSLLDPLLAMRRLDEVILFYRQLALLLEAGIPLYQALALRLEHAHTPRMRVALTEAVAEVERGGRVSDVFARHPWLFSEFQVAMLRAGEAGGALDTMASHVADYLEEERALRRFINQQMLYSKIVLVVAFFVLPPIMVFIMGGDPLRAILGPLQTALWLLVVGCLAVAVSRTALYESSGLADAWDAVKFALPGVAPVARAFAFSRFTRALGALYAAGLPIGSALEVAGRASGNRLVARAADDAARWVEQGVRLPDALRLTNVFPARTLEMLATGQESGRVDEMALRNAEYLAADAEELAHKSGFALGQVFYLFVAMMVLGVLQRGVGALRALLPF